MEIRVVSYREEIRTLDPRERNVHFSFRPSSRDIYFLVETCPKLELIQIPKSYRRTISKSVCEFLNMKGVQVIEGRIVGYKETITDYFNVPTSVIERIKELKSEGMPEEKIEKISKESKLSPELVSYILKKEVSYDTLSIPNKDLANDLLFRQEYSIDLRSIYKENSRREPDNIFFYHFVYYGNYGGRKFEELA